MMLIAEPYRLGFRLVPFTGVRATGRQANSGRMF